MSWKILGNETPEYFHSHLVVHFKRADRLFHYAEQCGLAVIGSDLLVSSMFHKSGFPHDILLGMLGEEDWILEHLIVEWLGFCRDAQPLGSPQ